MDSVSNEDLELNRYSAPPYSHFHSPWKYDVFLSRRGEDTDQHLADHPDTAWIDANISTTSEISSELLKQIEGARMSLVVLSENQVVSKWSIDKLVEETVKQRRIIHVFYDIYPTHVHEQTESFAYAFSKHEERFYDAMNRVGKWGDAVTEVANLLASNLQNSPNRSTSIPSHLCLLSVSSLRNEGWNENFSPPPTCSYSNSPWKYDVFLSFSGKDTRRSFTDHLYTALVDANISTFRDDKGLRKGARISSELLKAIEESRISIVILSKNYAASRWCLDELVKIMECKEAVKQRVIPVFYDIDPTHVRNQTGSFADAFSRHEERFVSESEMLQKWKVALTEVANLSGWNVQNFANGYESRSIQEIVGLVLHETNQKYLSSPKYPVGLDSHVKELRRLLHLGSDDVRIIGIYGMGGIGKTTMAKALYNSVCHLFEASCFLDNVTWQTGLVHLQENLDFELFGRKDLQVQDVLQVIDLLNRRLRSKRVLLILDELEEQWQVDALHRSSRLLGCGSRIIIVARDTKLLLAARADKLYYLDLLTLEESLRLLSWHAFHQPSPPEGYLELSEMLARCSAGHPLSLVLLGSSLFGRTKTEWESASREMQRFPNSEMIMTVIRICFDALPDEKIKDMFLNIACHLMGTEPAHIVDILNGCGFLAEKGMRVLIERCFLTISEDNTLGMHNLLRDFGREIVRENSHTQKFNKFWFHGDGSDVPGNYKGPEHVEGIFVAQQQIVHKAYARTSNSRVIPIDMVHPNRSFDGLKQVSWHQYPLHSLPAEANLEKLVTLQMHYSNITNLWQGVEAFPNLNLLDLSHSKFLTTTPDFSEVPRLEKLSLSFCQGLMKVHPSIGLLGKLTDLNFEGCNNLRTLPETICKLRSLKYLTLSGCLNLERLPEQLGNLESLWVLDASGTAIERLPDSIEFLGELLQLKLRSCENLRSLPNSICNVKSLRYLSLSYCSNLLSLPINLGHIESLMELDADGTAIRHLPHSIGLLKNLTKLSLQLCNRRLEANNKSWFSFVPFQLSLPYLIPKGFLPSSICSLSSLTHLNLRNCDLSEADIPINLDKLYSLQHLDLRENQFHSLPFCLGKLTNLRELQLSGCKSLILIRELPRKLQRLNASDCTSLETLPDISNLKHLECLNLENCCRLVEIQGLGNLHLAPDICLKGCSNLATTSRSCLHQGDTRFTPTTKDAGELSHVITKTRRDRFPDRMQLKQGHDVTLLGTIPHNSPNRKR